MLNKKQEYSPAEQLQMVEVSPYNLRFIANPTEAAQMKAVAQCWQVFRFMDRPGPKVRLLIP